MFRLFYFTPNSMCDVDTIVCIIDTINSIAAIRPHVPSPHLHVLTSMFFKLPQMPQYAMLIETATNIKIVPDSDTSMPISPTSAMVFV